MNCVGQFALALLLLAARCGASAPSADQTNATCASSNGTCRSSACCHGEGHRIIAGTKGCKPDEICCSLKPCRKKAGSCVPLGCCTKEKDTIVILDRNSECGSFAICCPYEAAAAEPKCTNNKVTPACGSRKTGIVESTDIRANRWEFPWSVAIFNVTSVFDREFIIFLCGGSLLPDGTIVTTAECVVEQEASLLRVHLGRWDLVADDEQCTQVLTVARIVLHEGYNGVSKGNNIALLLPGDIPQRTSSVNHICLPPTEPNETDRCYIIGWDSESSRSVNYMLKFKVRATGTLNDCRKLVQKNHPSSRYVLSPEHGCASVVDTMDKHYPCARVTGSGLVCHSATTGRYYLRGIALYALRNCTLSTINDLFVDVYAYSEWIRNKTGNQ
ncbi:serine protease 28-like [Anopheles aquasalis]|uniref:serine protease 28-like n=1 Tax=Anopheles aquasalis TaxID=42839 RepID=UPI00215AC9F7|nr:serine protease 28-like [Anopheles aquasalis]